MDYKKSVEYSLPNTQSVFKINKTSGVISLAEKLDYEKQKTYTFVVSVKDANNEKRSSCADVTLNVLDYNDNAPVVTYYPRTIRVDVVMYMVLLQYSTRKCCKFVGFQLC